MRLNTPTRLRHRLNVLVIGLVSVAAVARAAAPFLTKADRFESGQGGYPGLKRAAPVYHLSEAELGAQLARHNPIERLAPIARARIPILHIRGDTDKTVPIEKNSQVIFDRYRAHGEPMELIVVSGQGHNFHTAFFESQAVLKFLLKQALAAPKP